MPDAVGTGLVEGETGQGKPDWLFFASCRAASLPDEVGLTSLDAPPGITSWDVLPASLLKWFADAFRRLASSVFCQT